MSAEPALLSAGGGCAREGSRRGEREICFFLDRATIASGKQNLILLIKASDAQPLSLAGDRVVELSWSITM